MQFQAGDAWRRTSGEDDRAWMKFGGRGLDRLHATSMTRYAGDVDAGGHAGQPAGHARERAQRIDARLGHGASVTPAPVQVQQTHPTAPRPGVVEIPPGGQAAAAQVDQYRCVEAFVRLRDEHAGRPTAGARPEVIALEEDDGAQARPGTRHRRGHPDNPAAHNQDRRP
jgi:hypothetical protein